MRGIGFGLAGVAGFALLAAAYVGPARGDACEDADGDMVSVSTTITKIEKDDEYWVLWVADGASVGGCELDMIETLNSPPQLCRPGGRVDASGTFMDYRMFTSVLADSVSCR